MKTKGCFGISGAVAGFGGLVFLGLPCTAVGPQPATRPAGSAPPHIGTTSGLRGAVTGGPILTECAYDNYFDRKLDDFGSPASQKDVVYPFWAEAADDFVLIGDPANPCRLTDVWTSITFFNTPGGQPQDPLVCWDGVKVTIYEDITAGIPVGDPNCPLSKGPAGYPVDGSQREHVDCLVPPPSGIVCEMKVPMFKVDVAPQATLCQPDGFSWDLHLFGLEQFDCVLQKNHKYWIAISPVQQFAVCGQTAISLASNTFEHPAQQVFLLLGLEWTPIAGNTNSCPPNTPPAGSARDLAIAVFAEKVLPPSCPWDISGDGIVSIVDLIALLAAWGPGGGPADFDGDGDVDIVDLLKLLSNWGPCPAGLIIPPGIDCWDAPPFQSTYDFADQPIPTGFFGPGSDPFSGTVILQGAVSPSFVIRRNSAASLPAIGSQDTIPIEIVQLSLVSIQPITVTFNGGQNPQLWNVAVDLSPVLPPPGSMTITKQHRNGGVFTTQFNVQPRFTFTDPNNPGDIRVLDTGIVGLPPDVLILDPVDNAPWVSELDPDLPLPTCGMDFHPGIEQLGPDDQCCETVCPDGPALDLCGRPPGGPCPACPP